MNCRTTCTMILVSVLVLCIPRGRADAQTYGSDFHSVTVRVAAITLLQIAGGEVNLSVGDADATAGVDMMTVTDQSTALLWGTNSSGRKITVSTDVDNSLFSLTLVAHKTSSGPGNPAPPVTLSRTPTDLFYNIGRSYGSCDLQYTATALASQGTGTETHHITFTVQSQ